MFYIENKFKKVKKCIKNDLHAFLFNCKAMLKISSSLVMVFLKFLLQFVNPFNELRVFLCPAHLLIFFLFILLLLLLFLLFYCLYSYPTPPPYHGGNFPRLDSSVWNQSQRKISSETENQLLPITALLLNQISTSKDLRSQVLIVPGTTEAKLCSKSKLKSIPSNN